MLLHIIKRSFTKQKKAMALMVVSIAVGTAMAASLITISLEIEGKVAKELRAFGANILVEPKREGLADISGQKRYLRFGDIIKIKTIFWRHNIIGVSPYLEVKARVTGEDKSAEVDLVGAWYEKDLPLPGEKGNFHAGITSVSPGWYIEGEWPSAPDQVIIGISLASKLKTQSGQMIMLDGKEFTVSGILETGGKEDHQVFMDLEELQIFKNREGKLSRVLVSALTTPMDAFAYKDPETMTATEYEKWYCTGYVTSIAKQVEEIFTGSRTKPIWQVAETEGRVLGRMKILIYLLCVTALVASAIGVSTTMIMSLLRRIEEIGLMKAVGADSGQIISIFLTEGLLLGLIGGVAGYILSLVTTHYIGLTVFETALDQRAVLFFIAIGSAIIIAFAGTILPIRRALRIKSAIVLRGAE
jgi:putative ABC transport system permease protein